MTSNFGTAWRSFWHTMTSNDRHASHDSPYRTGQHVPLSQSRHEPLTSVVTSAFESRPDLSSFEEESSKQSMGSNPQSWSESQEATMSPTRPYSPGMRSLASKQRRSHEHNGIDGVATGEIQMQSFHDGAPPPPPVSHSWAKIDRWCEKNYEELFDQLCEGCTQNDVNELEHDLDCSLPLEVRESLMVHDGQERGGLPSGIIFGCMLLDCEEIVQEWKNWRTVNEEFLSSSTVSPPQPPLKAYGGASASASTSTSPAPPNPSNPLWRQELLDKQDSQPPRAIQKAYAHPSWIPLARDWGGNNLAVDLAPGPAGKWGQVIIFGRDYDCKYVVARSWAALLAVVADDLNSPRSLVDEETGELRLKPFRNADPPYLEVLRWRTDQKYGRKPPPKKRPGSGLGLNTNMNGKTSRDSPYGSPTPSATEERGRSPHRFPVRGSNGSPKNGLGGMSSPLARVTEETSSPVKSGGSTPTNAADPNLVDLTSPTASVNAGLTAFDSKKEPESSKDANKRGSKEKTDKPRSGMSTPRSSTGLDSKILEEDMKNVAI